MRHIVTFTLILLLLAACNTRVLIGDDGQVFNPSPPPAAPPSPPTPPSPPRPPPPAPPPSPPQPPSRTDYCQTESLSSLRKPSRAIGELSGGRAVRIVALGSSSTQGIGASSPSLSYPSQLQSRLRSRYPSASVEVVNKGLGGANIYGLRSKYEAEIKTLNPDVLIVQAGTIEAIDGMNRDEFRRALTDLVASAKGSSAKLEVILMDGQRYPGVGSTSAYDAYQNVVLGVAQSQGGSFVPRLQMMDELIRSGQFRLSELIGPDNLHMTDAMYSCLSTYLSGLFR